MKQAEKTLEFYKIKEQLKRYTACSLGKTRIDALSPFTDVVLLRRALAKTDEAMRLVNAYGPLGLGGLTDMSHALAKADMDGRLLPEELLRLVGLIDCVAHVLNYAKESQLDTPLFQADCAQLAVCHSLKREIERCISPEGEIVDHASPELARIRKAIRQTESQVRSKMNHYLISEKEHLAENIITMRNDRFVIPDKMGYQNQVRGIVHAQSASKQTAYIEPEAVVILNNQIQQFKSEEQDEMDRILFVLSQEVKKQAEKLRDQQEILGELDFIFAKGRYGHEHDCVITEISDDYQYFCLKQARHPLIDAKRVVANTLELALPQHILMITGSNTGGKTVNLKTAGLLSLMSLCGLAIPAQEAKIPFFDSKYVDMSHPNLNKWKVLIPAANGSGALGEVLSTPLIGRPLIGHTQTFLSIGAFDNEDEAVACLKYVKSKFVRVMLGILKVTQSNAPESWQYVPLQDFTVNSDIDWSVSISEIDRQLYKKYGLDASEIDFIETHVTVMY